ncbi:hypothetical protein CEXT_333681 [Caerostris extrusa]|uniref:Uncharacterized protein n=1 Tax=Caerostris extrusa TaxID=172846 RepID=A0AAV4Y040_CAEEX|nr:hypothetical protein CEXT_333681 [Caerostris extrusa]
MQVIAANLDLMQVIPVLLDLDQMITVHLDLMQVIAANLDLMQVIPVLLDLMQVIIVHRDQVTTVQTIRIIIFERKFQYFRKFSRNPVYGQKRKNFQIAANFFLNVALPDE